MHNSQSGECGSSRHCELEKNVRAMNSREGLTSGATEYDWTTALYGPGKLRTHGPSYQCKRATAVHREAMGEGWGSERWRPCEMRGEGCGQKVE